EHVARLHQPRSPSGLSVFALQGHLLHLVDVTSRARWRGRALERLDAKTASAVRDLLAEAGGFANLFLGTSPSAWNNAALADGAFVVAALDLAARLAHERLPLFEHRLGAVGLAAGLPAPRTLDATASFLALA